MLHGDNRVSTLQEGVFRTNCIDCLDRTNVVQSLLARVSLNEQLQVYLLASLEGGQLAFSDKKFGHLILFFVNILTL